MHEMFVHNLWTLSLLTKDALAFPGYFADMSQVKFQDVLEYKLHQRGFSDPSRNNGIIPESLHKG